MDWRFNTIWFEQLEEGKFFQKDCKEDTIATENKDFANSEYAIIWHLKEKKNPFDNLTSNDKLLYLELNWANIKNFEGIEKFNNLKRLELHNCVKLENDLGLGRLSNTIEVLHIDTSKKFNITDELLELNKLKVLALNSCAPVDCLEFLNGFPNLIDFRFVDTNIIDGNLNPILEHPTIRSVGFINKRHYNIKAEIVKKEVENKFRKEFKTVVQKGQYSTYRYDYD